MAHTGLTIPLLFLALVVGSNGADPLCAIVNATANSSSNFTLTVSPDTLSANTTYTVTLTGSGNYTVVLQALSASSPSGNWSATNISCDGSPLFQNPFGNGTQLMTQWTSPQSLTSVNIMAYLQKDNSTFTVSKTLSQATTNGTTVAPNTYNSTANSLTNSTANSTTNSTANSLTNSTANSTANSTTNSMANSTASTKATTLVKTTSAASAVQTSLVTVMQILGLLTITRKFLS